MFSDLAPWNLRRLFTRSRQTPTCQTPVHQHKLRLEALEDRTVPSSTTVSGGDGALAAAILAAVPGETIDVSGGPYSAIVIGSNSSGKLLNGLSLVAEGTVTIDPGTFSSPVYLPGSSVNIGGAGIDIYATNVVVNGFTVNGTGSNAAAGIRVIDGGSATIKNNNVENITGSNISDSNIGIQVGDALVSGSVGGGAARVDNNTVSAYAGAGVLVDGSYSAASVVGNTIAGRGTANNGIVEYGVQVSDGAAGSVELNTITNNTINGSSGEFNNPAVASAGIFVYDDSGHESVIALNCVSENDDGILVQNSSGSCYEGIQIINNTVTNNYGYAGIFVDSSNNVMVWANYVADNYTDNGIALNYSSNVVVGSNDITGNGIAGSETDGIYDYEYGDAGGNNLIEANNSWSNSGNGINLNYCTGDNVFNNFTWNNALSGIQDLDGVNDAIWLGDSSLNTQNGIYLIGTSGDTVVGNALFANGQYGLYLEGAKNTFVADNLVVDNSAGSIYIDSASTGTTLINNWTSSPPVKDGTSGASGSSAGLSSACSDADSAVSGLCN